MRGSCSGDKYSAFLSSSLFYSKVHLSLIADLETSTKTRSSMLRFLTVQHFVSIKFFEFNSMSHLMTVVIVLFSK